MKRCNKFLTVLLVLAVAAGLVVGCDVPAKKQEITVVCTSEFKGLHPSGLISSWGAATVLVYEPLADFENDYRSKVPVLAESWEMSPDGKEWTFYLRKGIKFHDGTELDSEDVKFTFDWKLKHDPSWLDYLEKVECLDKYTVKFSFSKPRFILSSDFGTPHCAIMSSTTPLDQNGEVKRAIGTGPFEITNYSSREVVLVRNDNYWRTKPKLEKVTMRVIPDSQAMVMALEAGEVDIIPLIEAFSVLPRLKENPNLEVSGKPSVGTFILYMNTQKEPFNDLRVRKAVNYAIDKKIIVEEILNRTGLPANYMFSPVFEKFINKDAPTYQYDLTKAKQLLKEAGWELKDKYLVKDGKPFEVSLTYQTGTIDFPRIVENIQYQLEQVGIKVVLNPVEQALRIKKQKSGDFDLLYTNQSNIPHDDPSNYYKAYFHSREGVYHYLKDPEIDNLIDQFEATGDENERLKLHYALQKEIMEKAPAVFIYHRSDYMAMKKCVKDFAVTVGSWMYYKFLDRAYLE